MSITNSERARRAAQALEKYKEVYHAPAYDAQEAITDLIADLLHLARKRKFDPDELIVTAQYHFHCETKDTTRR